MRASDVCVASDDVASVAVWRVTTVTLIMYAHVNVMDAVIDVSWLYHLVSYGNRTHSANDGHSMTNREHIAMT